MTRAHDAVTEFTSRAITIPDAVANALVLLDRSLPTGVPGAARFTLALALTLGLATLVYRGLEKPAMALGKRLAA